MLGICDCQLFRTRRAPFRAEGTDLAIPEVEIGSGLDKLFIYWACIGIMEKWKLLYHNRGCIELLPLTAAVSWKTNRGLSPPLWTVGLMIPAMRSLLPGSYLNLKP